METLKIIVFLVCFTIASIRKNGFVINTVLVIIKLTNCSVPVQLRCGFGKLKCCRYVTMV